MNYTLQNIATEADISPSLTPAIAAVVANIILHKGDDVIYANVDGYFCANVFIITCLSARHVDALLDESVKICKHSATRKPNINVDGAGEIGWSVLDLESEDCVFNFMTKEKRDQYDIEGILKSIV